MVEHEAMRPPLRIVKGARSTRAFAVMLAELRHERRWSQSELGRRCGLDHSYVSRIENETRVPSTRFLQNLVRALDLTPAQARRLVLAAVLNEEAEQRTETLDQFEDDVFAGLDTVWARVCALRNRYAEMLGDD